MLRSAKSTTNAVSRLLLDDAATTFGLGTVLLAAGFLTAGFGTTAFAAAFFFGADFLAVAIVIFLAGYGDCLTLFSRRCADSDAAISALEDPVAYAVSCTGCGTLRVLRY